MHELLIICVHVCVHVRARLCACVSVCYCVCGYEGPGYVCACVCVMLQVMGVFSGLTRASLLFSDAGSNSIHIKAIFALSTSSAHPSPLLTHSSARLYQLVIRASLFRSALSVCLCLCLSLSLCLSVSL